MARRRPRPYRIPKSARWLVKEAPAGPPPFRATLEVINDLRAKGLFADYAIGGGIGAMRYTEPFETYDLDVFFIPSTSNLTAGIPAIYQELSRRGYEPCKEHVVIEGLPVQFLATDALTREAVEQARTVAYADLRVRFMSPEHLVAIAVGAGRKKDQLRVGIILDHVKVDKPKLDDILKRHGLVEAYWAIVGKKP
ncbi:MAG: hypothetical protein AAB152_17790 [Candidatus Coatesbacteria bacterium]